MGGEVCTHNSLSSPLFYLMMAIKNNGLESRILHKFVMDKRRRSEKKINKQKETKLKQIKLTR